MFPSEEFLKVNVTKPSEALELIVSHADILRGSPCVPDPMRNDFVKNRKNVCVRGSRADNRNLLLHTTSFPGLFYLQGESPGNEVVLHRSN